MNKVNTMKNLWFMIRLIFKACPVRIIIMIIRQILDRTFYVFMFVYLVRYIYTAIQTNAPFNHIFVMISLICLGHTLLHILTAWYLYFKSKNDHKIYEYIYGKIIRKATQIELSQFESPDFYDKYTRALNESIERAEAVLESISFIIGLIAAISATMVLVISIDPFLLIFAIVLPFISTNIIGRIKNKIEYTRDLETTQINRKIDYVRRVFYETRYAKEIRLSGIVNLMLEKHRGSYSVLIGILKKYNNKLAFLTFLNSMVMDLGVKIGSVTYITYQILVRGIMAVADYVALMNAIGSMSRDIYELFKNIVKFKGYSLYIQNLKEFLEVEPRLKCNNKSTGQLISFETLELENVSFTYEGAETPVVKNINLKLCKGEKIAFVGHNGAGKTTIVKLVMRLYDASGGRIIVNGIEIHKLPLNDYYNMFSTIFQDYQLFSLSIAENVLMRNVKYAEDVNNIKKALELADFKTELDQLQNGVDSILTKEFDNAGVVLSGGNAQKIALARVFAKNSGIVILDEPSSALDPIAENNMYKNMMDAANDKAIIFISHRLSSAKMADRIYFLEHGEITEQGSHDELMKINGKYAAMFRMQAENYIDYEAV